MPKLLTIFNAYLQKGGEEEAVGLISRTLPPAVAVRDCTFSSDAWTGPDAPGRWQQARLMFKNPESLQVLREMHREFRPDAWLIHNVFPVGSAAIYPEAKRLGVPVIQYLHNFRPYSVNGYLWAGGHIEPAGLTKNFLPEIRHGAWQESRIKTAWFAFVLRSMHARGWWRGVDAWIANSDFVRDKMIAAGLPAKDIFTLYYPFASVGEIPAVEETHYLFLGRLIEAKGIKVLFETWRKLVEQLGARTPRLLIAGQGPLADWVMEQARAFSSVTYAGQISGEVKARALAGARAVIAPSLWWEAFGLIACDAYAYAKPMLAARSGGLTETVSDGRTGFLHEPGDSAQLAEQIIQLENNPALRQRMGMEGNRWLKTNTSPEIFREKFVHVFARATRSKSRAGSA